MREQGPYCCMELVLMIDQKHQKYSLVSGAILCTVDAGNWDKDGQKKSHGMNNEPKR